MLLVFYDYGIEKAQDLVIHSSVECQIMYHEHSAKQKEAVSLVIFNKKKKS